jgi:transposase
MYHGAKLRGRWWRPRAWSQCREQLEEWLVSLLSPVRDLIVRTEEHMAQLEQQLVQQACGATARPKGLGQLSHGLLAGEVLDWGRFKNRRQVASYTGLCPSEHSSGGKRRQGAINKHGNPRLRHVLVEAVWRLIQWQPQWVRWEKIRVRFAQAKAPERKKLVVALARQLAIDLWRLHMGTATLEKLGLSPAT